MLGSFKVLHSRPNGPDGQTFYQIAQDVHVIFFFFEAKKSIPTIFKNEHNNFSIISNSIQFKRFGLIDIQINYIENIS